MVEILSIQRISETRIRVTTTELANGVDYKITVTGVEDTYGNAIDPNTNNNAIFSGVSEQPNLISVTAIDSSHIDITFDKDMEDGSTLAYTKNYSLSGAYDIPISLAKLDEDKRTVHLTFLHKILNGTYTIEVNNLPDTSGNAMSIIDNTKEFSFLYTFPVMNMIGISDISYTDGSLVTLYIQGISSEEEYPTIQLKIDDEVVSIWTNVKKYIDIYFDNYWVFIGSYIHSGQVTIDQIKVEFVNAQTEAPDVAGLLSWEQDPSSTATISTEREYLDYNVKIYLNSSSGDPLLNGIYQELAEQENGTKLTASAQMKSTYGVTARMELHVEPAGGGEIVEAQDFSGTGEWINVALNTVTTTETQTTPKLYLITKTPDASGYFTEWKNPRLDQELIENSDFNGTIDPWFQHVGSRITVTAESELAGTYAHSVITKDEASSSRVYHSIVFDSSRQVHVMFGGWDAVTPYFNDTWEWDDTEEAWKEISVTGGVCPSVRGRHCMVYDSNRNKCILFGGNDGVNSYNDTWEYTGNTSTWEEISTVGGVKPSIRYSAASAFDNDRNIMILFGGYTATGYNNETWKYDGSTSTWTQISPVGDVKPSSRYYSSMVYDSENKKFILFGGLSSSSRLNDTWEFDPVTNTWLELSPFGGVSPSARSEHSMVFDQTEKTCVLFGGQDGAIGVEHLVDDTWIFNYATLTWTNVNIGEYPGVSNPSARVAFSMSYNSSDSITLLFGGYTGSMNGETWRYNYTTALWTLFEINPDPNNYGPSHWNSLIQSFGQVGYNKDLVCTGKYRAAVGTIVRIELYATPWSGDFIPTTYLTYPGTGEWEDFQLFPFNTSDDHDTVEIRLVVYSPDTNGVWADFKNISVGKNILSNSRFRPRTALVDRVILDGYGYTTYGNDVYSTGTWEPGDGSSVIPGYKQSPYLTNTGHFDYSEVDTTTIYEGVNERIDTYRKGNCIVTVKDGSDNPIDGATISIEQIKHSFLFGSTVHWLVWRRETTPAWIPLIDEYEARWADLFNLGFAPFFWQTYEPTEGNYQTAFLDQYIDWCVTRNADVRGIALLYNIAESSPDWLESKDPATVKTYLLNYITHAMTTYAGKVKYWEIVDEAAIWDSIGLYTGAPALTKLYRTEGRENLIWDVYNTAKTADPSAYLEINDFHTDDRYFSLLQKLERGGIFPFDGIKLQSHLNEDVWSNQKLWWLLNKLGSIKSDIHLSEVSIFSGRPYTTGNVLLDDFSEPITAWPTTTEGEAQQAVEVERFYKLAFSNPYVKSISWWDLSDFYAWGWSGSNTNIARGLLRPDMTKKPAFDVLYNLIKNEWWTTTSGNSNNSGQFAFRGFAGTYTITVSKNGYVTKTETKILTVSGDTWDITLDNS